MAGAWLDFLGGLALLLFAISLIVWKFYGVDPFLLLARGLVVARCGCVIASRYAAAFYRDWPIETLRLYRHQRRIEGV